MGLNILLLSKEYIKNGKFIMNIKKEKTKRYL